MFRGPPDLSTSPTKEGDHFCPHRDYTIAQTQGLYLVIDASIPTPLAIMTREAYGYETSGNVGEFAQGRILSWHIVGAAYKLTSLNT
jgi:hypothetical protein